MGAGADNTIMKTAENLSAGYAVTVNLIKFRTAWYVVLMVRSDRYKRNDGCTRTRPRDPGVEVRTE